HSNSVRSVAFSPDGKTLASGSDDNTIKLWDVATGKLSQTLTGHSNSVRSVAFSPDGKTLASGSDDNTIKLWDVATGKLSQ
ncbi:WD40 repeat domain-containing protein, partial [Hassallia sp. VBCCA 56010]